MQTRILRQLTIAALLTATCVAAAGAQGRGRGRGNGEGEQSKDAAASRELVVFRDNDRTAFHDYFVKHHTKYKALPPGIAKNLARGKPLPPGIAKRMLPPDLVVLAPKVDRDVSFAIVGDAVVALRGGIVLDVMVGIFP